MTEHAIIRPHGRKRMSLAGNDVRFLGVSLFALEMSGTAFVLQLISLFFCCGKFTGKDCMMDKPERLTATYIDQEIGGVL